MADRLSGANEVPPVSTSATGTVDITVRPTKCPSSASSMSCPSIAGSVVTSGIDGTAAHIHIGKKGENGPVVIPLEKGDANVWVVPALTFLQDNQYAAYLDGELYVNVHSAAYPNGEVRAQLRP